jgi:NAD(P)-dependent dehydrogenase (short-subunit alcohol dehydrogenase family)
MSVILVIGASRGLGLEFVRQYTEAGDRVIATVRDAAGRARVQALGAEVLTLDVSQPASVSGLASQLGGEKIDTALYVAGVYASGTALSQPTRELFDRTLHTNVLGAMQVLPQVGPLVEAAEGHFAFISSGLGHIGSVESSQGWTYRVSKAALNMAVASAQHDYPAAILVALCPGWVRTDLGGPNASLSASDSVRALRATLGALTPAHKGQFFHHDGRPFAGW